MSVRETITPEQLATYTQLAKERKQLRKKGSKGVLLFYVICMIFGGCIGGFGAYFLEEGLVELSIQPPIPVEHGLLGVNLFVILVLFYTFSILQIIIHESGHLLFGLMTGYRFLSFRIFSFTLVKKDGKLVRKKLKVKGIPGQCLMAPPEWKDDARYPYVRYNLGGGVLNLLSCILAVPLFFLHIPFVSWMAGMFIFSGVILGLTNLIPMSMGIPNDGKNCLLCKQARANQRAFYLQLKINAMMSDGLTVKEMEPELFEQGEEAPVNALTCFVELMKYYRLLQTGDTAGAKEVLARVAGEEKKLPLAFVNMVDLERVYCLLREDAPLEEVAAYCSALLPVFAQNRDLSILRVKYAYCVLLTAEERELIDWLVYSKNNKLPKKLPKRKPETAEQLYEEMEKALLKHPVIGEAELYMDLAREL